MFRIKRRTAPLQCSACQRDVRVAIENVSLFVCIEDGWYTCVFTCPDCCCKRTQDPSPALLQQLSVLGVATTCWSVSEVHCPIVVDEQNVYKPRRVSHTWLAFDETDVVLLGRDMNTSNWFELLAAYDPHQN